jgi:four helix bundle protein
VATLDSLRGSERKARHFGTATDFSVTLGWRLLATVRHDRLTESASAEQLDIRRVPKLRNQLLRATDAVPANIAEGARGSRPEFAQFLRIALRSADEVGAHLMVAMRVQALPLETYQRCESKRVVVCKMLHGLLRAVEEQHARGGAPAAREQRKE